MDIQDLGTDQYTGLFKDMRQHLLCAISRTVDSFNSRDVVKALWAIKGLRLQAPDVQVHLLQAIPAIAPGLNVRRLTQEFFIQRGISWSKS